MKNKSRIARILGWVCTGPVVLMLLASVFIKLTVTPESDMGRMFLAVGIYGYLAPLAVVDARLAILLLVPRTATVGYLLTFGYWSGAVAAHLTHQYPFDVQPLMALLTLGGTFFRAPELFSRLLYKDGDPVRATNQPAVKVV